MAAADRTVRDRGEMYEEHALTLRTIGGLFFIEAFIICEWIWMGLKAGSGLWLWATIVLGVAGMACFALADDQRRRSVETLRFYQDGHAEPAPRTEYPHAA